MAFGTQTHKTGESGICTNIASLSPGTISGGAQGTVTATVNRAAPGMVFACAFGAALDAGLVLAQNPTCLTAGVVSFVFQNVTSSPITGTALTNVKLMAL